MPISWWCYRTYLFSTVSELLVINTYIQGGTTWHNIVYNIPTQQLLIWLHITYYTKPAEDCDGFLNDNTRWSDELIDLQTRSMRDTLVFYGWRFNCRATQFRECTSKLLHLWRFSTYAKRTWNYKNWLLSPLVKLTAGTIRQIVVKFKLTIVRINLLSSAKFNHILLNIKCTWNIKWKSNT